MLAAINALDNPKAQKLGVMILATSQRLDQLWTKCTPAMVLGWMAKTQVCLALRTVILGATCPLSEPPFWQATQAQRGACFLVVAA